MTKTLIFLTFVNNTSIHVYFNSVQRTCKSAYNFANTTLKKFKKIKKQRQDPAVCVYKQFED